MQYNKFIFVILTGFILGCNSSEQNHFELHPKTEVSTVLSDALVLNKNKGIVFYNGQLFTGTAISKYPNDSIASSIDYVNGKKEGIYRKWFQNGKLSFEANYVNGKQHGKTYTWWSNGNLRTTSNFANGIPDGEQLQYYKSGSLFKKIQLVKGKEEGLQQSWRENGKLYNNYEAKNGRIFGLKRSKLCFKLDDEEVQY